MQDLAPLAESAKLLSIQALPGNYTQFLLHAPQSVTILKPGQYLSCQVFKGHASACMPVMRMDSHSGTLECLYRNRTKIPFSHTLQGHDRLIVSPQGKGWNLDGNESHIVFLAQDEGLACIVDAASRLRLNSPHKTLTALLEFDGAPPFTPIPSQILLPGAPVEALACAPLLEDWGIASQLADPGDQRIPKPGWFSGTATELAATWFKNLNPENYRLACCGNQSFVDAVLKLANHWRLPAETTVLPDSGRLEKPGLTAKKHFLARRRWDAED